MSRRKLVLPVGPLMAYMHRNGGLDALALFYPHHSTLSSNGNPVEPRTAGIGGMKSITVTLNPECRKAYRADRRAILRAIEFGFIPFHRGDDLACRVFGVHPALIWGSDYWHPVSVYSETTIGNEGAA